MNSVTCFVVNRTDSQVKLKIRRGNRWLQHPAVVDEKNESIQDKEDQHLGEHGVIQS